jgi:hypothetical protein
MSSPPAALDAQQNPPGVPADLHAAFRFLDLLFTQTPEGFVEFRYFNSGKGRKNTGESTYLNLPLDHEQIQTEVLCRDGQQLIVFGPAARFRALSLGAAGKDHDVLEVGCVWATLEHNRTKGGAIEVLRRLRDFPLRPSVVVSTGFAHQVYFVLREPFRDGGLLEWSELTSGLCLALSAGTPPTLSGIAILPGTTNLQESRPVSCGISEEYSSWVPYSSDEVAVALKAAGGKNSLTAASDGEGTDSSHSVEQLRQRGLGAEVIEAIVTGRGLPRPGYDTSSSVGESGPDYRLSYRLFEKGFAENEIKAIFRAHSNGCGRKWARHRDGERYLDSLLRKVIAKHTELRDVSPSGVRTGEGKGLWGGLPPNYVEHEDGALWFHPPVTDEGRKAPRPMKVCHSPLRITGIQEHVDTGQVSVLISFRYLGREISTSILRSQMADARQLVAALSGVGAPITSINSRLVTAYLAAYEHHFAPAIPKHKVTSRLGRGRADDAFFFPGVSTNIRFSPLGAGDAALYRAYSSRGGSMRGWLEVMGSLASEGLMIPQIAVLAAFVPPLQRRLQIPNFILDLHGNTSTGKSTSLKLAASVYGKPSDPDSLILQWTNTSVAIEQVAATCSELPVFLDDAQHCPPEFKRSVIYMIANGRGKGRGALGGRGGTSETPTWHTVALSTSEEPLHAASPHEGARGRILPVGGLNPPFRAGSASFVQEVERTASHNHGHAGEAYIRHVGGWTAGDAGRWHQRYELICGELLKVSSSNVAARVSRYVAAIQLAAEVACPLLGLPFKPDVASAWLMLHLLEQDGAENLVLRAARVLADYYVGNTHHFAGDGLHRPESAKALYGVARRQQYVGFLRSAVETAFRQHKWNTTAVLNKMTEAGLLIATEDDRHTKKVSTGGVKHRMVCVRWANLFPDESDL